MKRDSFASFKVSRGGSELAGTDSGGFQVAASELGGFWRRTSAACRSIVDCHPLESYSGPDCNNPGVLSGA